MRLGVAALCWLLIVVVVVSIMAFVTTLVVTHDLAAAGRVTGVVALTLAVLGVRVIALGLLVFGALTAPVISLPPPAWGTAPLVTHATGEIVTVMTTTANPNTSTLERLEARARAQAAKRTAAQRDEQAQAIFRRLNTYRQDHLRAAWVRGALDSIAGIGGPPCDLPAGAARTAWGRGHGAMRDSRHMTPDERAHIDHLGGWAS